jgi:hypothetical protein
LYTLSSLNQFQEKTVLQLNKKKESTLYAGFSDLGMDFF